MDSILMVVIDAYSKFPEVDLVNSTSASATLPKLERIFATHGFPHFVRTDNRPLSLEENFAIL